MARRSSSPLLVICHPNVDDAVKLMLLCSCEYSKKYLNDVKLLLAIYVLFYFTVIILELC